MSASPSPRFSVTHGMVMRLALPMTLAYMTTPLLGLVDTGVVGRLGNPALIGGLAVGAIIIDLVFTTFNFLRSGITGLTAQAVGAEDEKETQAILLRGLLIAILSGIGMMVASWPILILGLYFMDVTGEIAAATTTYFLIRMVSAPFALANYAILGWMIGLGKSGTGLTLQILLNGVNIVLSILLGLTFGFGIAGVAAATVVGEVIACFAGLYWCYRLANSDLRPSKSRIFNRPAFIRLAHLNSDIMIRSFALVFAFAFFTAQGTQLGETTLAANAILMHFFIIGGYFLDGQATAAEQIVGRAIGARYKQGFISGMKLTLFWSFLLALLLSAIYWTFGNHLINLITTLVPVRAEATNYLLWAALTPISGMLAFFLDGVFIGATWSRDMSRMMLVSLAIYLAVWWLTFEPYGNSGLWLSLHAFLLARGLTLTLWVPHRTRQAFDA